MGKHNLLQVAILGTESTGKSTLAKELTDRFQGVLVSEHVRQFVDLGGVPSRQNFDDIARGQLLAMEQGLSSALAQKKELVVYDTCLITSLAYGRQLMQLNPLWLVEAIHGQSIDHYILLADDVPWIADGQREFGEAAARRRFQQLLQSLLAEFNQPYQVIAGDFSERLAKVSKLVSGWMIR